MLSFRWWQWWLHSLSVASLFELYLIESNNYHLANILTKNSSGGRSLNGACGKLAEHCDGYYNIQLFCLYCRPVDISQCIWELIAFSSHLNCTQQTAETAERRAVVWLSVDWYYCKFNRLVLPFYLFFGNPPAEGQHRHTRTFCTTVLYCMVLRL